MFLKALAFMDGNSAGRPSGYGLQSRNSDSLLSRLLGIDVITEFIHVLTNYLSTQKLTVQLPSPSCCPVGLTQGG